MAADALHDHAKSHQVAPALWDDDVGVLAAGLDELLMHGLDGGQVLVDDRVQRAAPLLHVPEDAAEYAHIGVGVHDGRVKARTTIGGNVFIGCHTKFIPPVSVGDGAYIAAGTTVTEDVPAQSFVIGRSRQTIKTDWKDKRNRK